MSLYEVTAKPRSNLDVILIAANEDPPEDPHITLWKSVIKQAVFDVEKAIDMEAFELGIAISRSPKQSRMPEKCRRAINTMRLRVSSMYWLFKSDSDDVRSLQWICDHIGYHIDDVRAAALEYINASENTDETHAKKYHKPKGRRRPFHVVSGNATMGEAL